jgi:hypothetical protein
MDKKPLSFPKWLEVAIILLLLITAVLEYNSRQYVWSVIFALGGLLYGAALITRLLAGDPNARK